MRCGTARTFVQEGLDASLSPSDEALVEAHLRHCPGCWNFATGLRRSIGALEDLSRQAAPFDFGATVKFHLRHERMQRNWMPPVAIAAAVLAGIVVAGPALHRASDRAWQRRSSQLAADQATAEFMHWMDPSADGVSGLAVQQAAFNMAVPYAGQQLKASPSGR